MKKKFMLAVAAIFAATSLSLSSCGGSPADKIIDVAKDATEQFKNASSTEELDKILSDTKSKIKEIMLENVEYKPTEEETKAMLEAEANAEKAYELAKTKFTKAEDYGLSDLGRAEEAISIYLEGIELAKNATSKDMINDIKDNIRSKIDDLDLSDEERHVAEEAREEFKEVCKEAKKKF